MEELDDDTIDHLQGVQRFVDAVRAPLVRRVAELEARLADEWRPVTEDELPAGMLIEVRFVTVVDEFTGAPAICTGNPSYRPDGFMWRPLPPLPAATE